MRVRARHGDPDRPAGWGVPQGVLQQVGQDLGHPLGVHVDVGQGAGALHGELDLAGAVGVLCGGSRGIHNPPRVDVDGARVDLSLLGAGDGADVLGEALQPLGAAAQRRERRLVEVAYAVLDCLEVGLDGRQGGAHLVGEVSEDASARGLDVTETFGEVVDGGGELVEVRSQTRAGDAPAVLSVGDGRRCLRHLRGGALNPSGEVAGHQQRHEDRGQQRHAERDDQCRAERVFDVSGLRGGVPDIGSDEVLVEDARGDDGSHDPRGGGRSQKNEGLGGQ